jgi:hypothetical protein
VRAEIAELMRRLAQLRDEECGLVIAIARHAGEETSDDVRPQRQTPSSGARKRLTPLVRAVLAQEKTPLDRHAIADLLASSGIDATADSVSASLSYLQRTGVVVKVEGKWVHRMTALPETVDATTRSPQAT